MFIIFGKIITEFSEIFMRNIFFVAMSKKRRKSKSIIDTGLQYICRKQNTHIMNIKLEEIFYVYKL